MDELYHRGHDLSTSEQERSNPEQSPVHPLNSRPISRENARSQMPPAANLTRTPQSRSSTGLSYQEIRSSGAEHASPIPEVTEEALEGPMRELLYGRRTETQAFEYGNPYISAYRPTRRPIAQDERHRSRYPGTHSRRPSDPQPQPEPLSPPIYSKFATNNESRISVTDLRLPIQGAESDVDADPPPTYDEATEESQPSRTQERAQSMDSLELEQNWRP